MRGAQRLPHVPHACHACLGDGAAGTPPGASARVVRPRRPPLGRPHSPAPPLHRGDARLRSSFGQCTAQLLQQLGARPVVDALDVGCATGLSSLALLRQFEGAHCTGVDLSPHFLAVGRHLQSRREAAAGELEPLQLLHALAEDTRLPAGSYDLVSTCLVFHELPQEPARAILREAFRLLRPGGALAIMVRGTGGQGGAGWSGRGQGSCLGGPGRLAGSPTTPHTRAPPTRRLQEMNPNSEIFKRIFSNPFPYVAFKSTEPFLIDYITLDLHGAIQDAGFKAPLQLQNSPRHRTVVALKPVS